MRLLAHAAQQEVHPLRSLLYKIGDQPSCLLLILDGTCAVCHRAPAAAHPEPASPPGQQRAPGAPRGAALRPGSPARPGARAMSGNGGGRSGTFDWPGGQPGLGQMGFTEAAIGQDATPEDGSAAAAAAAALRRRAAGGLSPRRQEHRVEVGLLGPGDVAGEALLLGEPRHVSGVVVTSDHVTVLRIDRKDVARLWHPADLALLRGRLVRRAAHRAAAAGAPAPSDLLSAAGAGAGTKVKAAAPGEQGGAGGNAAAAPRAPSPPRGGEGPAAALAADATASASGACAAAARLSLGRPDSQLGRGASFGCQQAGEQPLPPLELVLAAAAASPWQAHSSSTGAALAAAAAQIVGAAGAAAAAATDSAAASSSAGAAALTGQAPLVHDIIVALVPAHIQAKIAASRAGTPGSPPRQSAAGTPPRRSIVAGLQTGLAPSGDCQPVKVPSLRVGSPAAGLRGAAGQGGGASQAGRAAAAGGGGRGEAHDWLCGLEWPPSQGCEGGARLGCRSAGGASPAASQQRPSSTLPASPPATGAGSGSGASRASRLSRSPQRAAMAGASELEQHEGQHLADNPWKRQLSSNSRRQLLGDSVQHRMHGSRRGARGGVRPSGPGSGGGSSSSSGGSGCSGSGPGGSGPDGRAQPHGRSSRRLARGQSR